MTSPNTIGFVGLGVMGSGMCWNLARKSGARVVAHDARKEAVEALCEDGVEPAESITQLAAEADMIFLSLPGKEEVHETCLGTNGLLEAGRQGQTVVDFSTTPVSLARELAERFATKSIDFADCPVARTREAARQGTLSVMIGADAAVLERVRPFLECIATDISHCGGVGTGQVLKLCNNMLVFTHVVALAEAMTVAERSGVDRRALLDILAKGSADSFVLRNHGMKAMAPREFPSPAFSSDYAVKDLDYALEMGSDNGVALGCAELVRQHYRRAGEQGFGDEYFPAVIKVVEGNDADPGSKGT